MSSRGRETKPGSSAEGQNQESAASTATDLRQLAMAKRARDRKSIPEGGGTSLDDTNRSRMEGQLGGDLSGVRIHTGGESARAADDLQARAFTSGKDIHFGAGEYQPGTRDGDHLLAHELSHAVQGTRAPIARYAKPGAEEMGDAEGVSKSGEEDEKKADQDAGSAVDGLHDAGGAPGKKGQPDKGGAEIIKGTTGIIMGS